MKFGSAEKEEEWATTHFWFSVVIEIADFMSRQQVLYCNKVEYWQASWVATGQCVLRQGRTHGSAYANDDSIPSAHNMAQRAQPGSLGRAIECKRL